ncbi:hypothetical protein NIB75_14540 [Bacteroides uniformis]|nr:hypothetical protein [Bacteroides uniformis]
MSCVRRKAGPLQGWLKENHPRPEGCGIFFRQTLRVRTRDSRRREIKIPAPGAGHV